MTTNIPYCLKDLVETLSPNNPIEITISIEHSPDRLPHPFSCAIYAKTPKSEKALYEYGEAAKLNYLHEFLEAYLLPLKTIIK